MSSRRPSSVHIREVGPRDGFQNEPETIGTADKIALINELATTGLRRIEVASFVRPDVIPQLSDGVEVLNGIDVPESVALMVLIPNSKGLDNALRVRGPLPRGGDLRQRLADPQPPQRQPRRRGDDGRQRGDGETDRRRGSDLRGRRRDLVSAAPSKARVPMDRVLDLAEQFAESGATEIGFGDTTGMANPGYVGEFFAAAIERLPGVEVTAHFHNTRGQGLANAYAALEAGCTSFESSFGELGGCPVPAGSTGNIASEDLDQHVRGDGRIHRRLVSGIIDAARSAQRVLGRKLTSHGIVAGPIEWDTELPDAVCR